MRLGGRSRKQGHDDVEGETARKSSALPARPIRKATRSNPPGKKAVAPATNKSIIRKAKRTNNPAKRKREMEQEQNHDGSVSPSVPEPKKLHRDVSSPLLLRRASSKDLLLDNGTPFVLDADALVSVFGFLSLKDILVARQVCSWWYDIASSNPVWKSLFNETFGYPDSELSLLSGEDRMECDDAEEDKKDLSPQQDVNRRWLYEFLQVAKLLPKYTVVKIPGLKATKKRMRETADEEMDGESLIMDNMYFHFFDLVCPSGAVDLQMHKLAVILSLMHCNQYTPNYSDYVQVGYADTHSLMRLSQFCYGILAGKEDTIFPLKENDCDHMIIHGADSEDGSSPYNAEVEKELEERQCVGVGPYVRGEFKPFVYYRAMNGNLMRRQSKFGTVVDEETDAKIFGSPEGLRQVYTWSTDEIGWAPIFFNASFSWFYHVNITSAFNKSINRLIISQVKLREVVW